MVERDKNKYLSGIALVYRQRTSASFLGLPATHCLLATRKRVSRIEYAQLICFSIAFQLICNIFLYRFCVLPYRVYVISFAPKFAISVCKFHISPFLKYDCCTLSFQIPHKSRNAHFWWQRYKNMYVIRTYFSFDYFYAFPLTQLP